MKTKALWTKAFPPPAPASAAPRRRSRTRVRAREAALYRKLSRNFVSEALERGHCCPVIWAAERMYARINQTHHIFGRRGGLLLWKPGWLAVSSRGHALINANPEWARAMGFLGPIGTYNDFARAVAHQKKKVAHCPCAI